MFTPSWQSQKCMLEIFSPWDMLNALRMVLYYTMDSRINNDIIMDNILLSILQEVALYYCITVGSSYTINLHYDKIQEVLLCQFTVLQNLQIFTGPCALAWEENRLIISSFNRPPEPVTTYES